MTATTVHPDSAAQPLRFGILGAARIAPNGLIKPARAIRGVQVQAIGARDLDRAQRLAREYAIPSAYGAYDAVIDDPDVDAVYVALPNALHAEWSMRAMQAGKHVLCEKPLASNTDEALRIEAVAAETGLLFAEAFHNLYHSLILRMREIVRSGALGQVQGVRGVFNTTIRRREDIRFSYALGGGAMMDLGCYLVSLTRFLFDAGTPTVADPQAGEPRVLTARANLLSPDVDSEMHARLSIAKENAAPIEVELTCGMRRWKLPQVFFTVLGTKGRMQCVNPILPHLWHRLTVEDAAGKRILNVPRISTYQCQLQAFCTALLDGRPMPTDATQGVRNMAVIDAIYLAAGLSTRQAALPPPHPPAK